MTFEEWWADNKQHYTPESYAAAHDAWHANSNTERVADVDRLRSALVRMSRWDVLGTPLCVAYDEEFGAGSFEALAGRKVNMSRDAR